MARNAGTDLIDELLSVLSVRRRRLALQCLLEHEHALSRRALAEALLVRERGVPNVPAAECERVAVALHHVHLPKLRDVGLVRNEADGDDVAATERAEWLEPLLLGIEAYEHESSEYFDGSER